MFNNLITYPYLRQDFQLSTYLQQKDDKHVLTIYVIHSKRKEVFTTVVNDAIRVNEESMKFELKPKKIMQIIQKYFDHIIVSEDGNISITTQILFQMIEISLPPSKKDIHSSMTAQIRIRQLQHHYSEKAIRSQQKIAQLELRVQKVQALVEKAIRSMHDRAKFNQPFKQSAQKRQDQNIVDEKIQFILQRVNQQEQARQNHIQQKIEEHIQALNAQNIRTMEIINEGKIKNVEEFCKKLIDQRMRQIRQETQNRLIKVWKQIHDLKDENFAKKIKEIEQKIKKDYKDDLFSECEGTKCPISTVIKQNCIEIENAKTVTDRDYLHFFSKLTIKNQQDISFRLNILEGDKPLFGITTNKAKYQKDIYKHSTSFFHTVGEQAFHIGGVLREQDEKSYLVEASHDQVEQSHEIVMHVDFINWQIFWDFGRGQSSKYPIPLYLRKEQFHPVILIGAAQKNIVRLSYA